MLFQETSSIQDHKVSESFENLIHEIYDKRNQIVNESVDLGAPVKLNQSKFAHFVDYDKICIFLKVNELKILYRTDCSQRKLNI